jgi:hypothetical protein
VVGSVAAGKQREVYLLTPQGPKRQEVLVGLTNDKLVEIKTGLKDGDQVILNPQAVKAEDESRTRPTREEHEENGNKDWKAKRFSGMPEKATKGKAPASKTGTNGSARPTEGAQQVNPEETQKRQKEWLDRLRKATPKERKQMIEQLPEQWREAAKQGAKAQGIEIPD